MASYAERHPECVRPEDFFVYRFSVFIEMSSPEVARNRVLHGTDRRPKDLRFSPALPVAPVFREWETEAAPVLAGRQRRLKVLSVNTMDMSNEMLESALPDGVAAIVMSDRESADADNAAVEVLDVLTGEVLN